MSQRGVIVGRFQPPHLGHLELIKHALTQVDEVIIAIAAAQISHTLKNPLTAGERVELMRVMIQNADIPLEKVWIIPTQDIMDNALWISHIQRLLPEFQVFFGNNPFTILLFEEKKIETRTTPMFSREKYEASRIRDLLQEGKSVKNYLDKDVIKLLKSYNIRRRLTGIVNNDKKFNSEDAAGSELANM